MIAQPGLVEIAVRLALTILAGTLVGINRGEHGRPAGLRTTLLVCLAASITMIQVDLLLPTAGKAADSFVTLDLMRLPLGVLSGMGFIGGGVILKRDNLVMGVTTAATLWFVTILGLCFGAGLLALGGIALGLGMVVLWGLKPVELFLPEDRRASLSATLGPGAPSVDDLCDRIRSEGFRILSVGLTIEPGDVRKSLHCELQWRERPSPSSHLAFAEVLAGFDGIQKVVWHPNDLPHGLA